MCADPHNTASLRPDSDPVQKTERKRSVWRDTRSPWALPLEKVHENHRLGVGGKAANLAKMMHAKLPVPPGFCVTVAAFEAFVDSCPQREKLWQVRSQFAAAEPDQVIELSQRSIACLRVAPIPPKVEEAVLRHWRHQGEERAYAVRSSATAEDGRKHSFAGQFESILNVRGRDALLAAIKQCWLSLYSERALVYQVKEGLSAEKVAMAVVVQEMVPADVAGVLFTTDPVSGSASRMVIESVRGLGDQLVSGRVNPECVVLEKATLRVVRRQTGAEALCVAPVLVRRLGKLGRKVERLFGEPQDIEWAIAGGRLFVLQARPVIVTRPERTLEERQVWTNLNTGEVLPDVTTPMTWSVLQHLITPLFQSVFQFVGADMLRAPSTGLVAGRIYFNTNTGLAAMKPFSWLLDRIPHFAQALGGGHTEMHRQGLLEIPDEALPDLGFSWARYIRSWPRLFARLIAHSPRKGDAWILRLKARQDALACEDFDSLSTIELANRFADLLDFQGWDLLYLGTQGAWLLPFQKACHDWLDDPGLTLGFRLFAALGGVPETEAGLALWRLATLARADRETEAVLLTHDGWQAAREKLGQTEQGRRFLGAWEAFMAEHGHHCRGELELFNPRWSETPDYILSLVRGYLATIGQTDPLENQRRLAEEREELTAQCRRRLKNPIKRWIFSRALRRAQKLAVFREEWKNQAVRHIAVLRRLLLRLGARLWQEQKLQCPNHIFFLELTEIEPVVRGHGHFDAKAVVRQRRAEYETNLTLAPPPVVVGQFDPNTQTAPRPEAATDVLCGIPVYPGVVTGPARVILRTDDHEQVLPGEILVAPFTDPAWTPYFITAAGVVMDQGGILSHGSIVAREYGLPAVTNVGSATRTIRTGDLVEVNGTCGRITVLHRNTG